MHARIEAGEAARRLHPGPSSTATLTREPAADVDQLDPQLRSMVDRIRGGQTAATEATRSPVPNPLEKARDHTTRPTDADRGIDR